MKSVMEHQSQWNRLVSKGLEVREQRDGAQWELGDLAGEIDKDYGQDSIGKFAQQINMAGKTLRNYRIVSRTFKKEQRNYLSFSHYAHLTTVSNPMEWVYKARDNEWSVDQLASELRKVKKIKPPPLHEAPEVYRCEKCNMWRLKDLSSFDMCRGHYHFENGEINYG